MLYLTSWIVDDFTIDSFWWAFLATIIVWLVNTVLEAVLRGRPGLRTGYRSTWDVVDALLAPLQRFKWARREATSASAMTQTS